MGNDTSVIFCTAQAETFHQKNFVFGFSLQSHLVRIISMIGEEGIDFGMRFVTFHWPYSPDLMLVAKTYDFAVELLIEVYRESDIHKQSCEIEAD